MDFTSVPLSDIEVAISSIFFLAAVFFILLEGGRLGAEFRLPLFLALLLRTAAATTHRLWLIIPDGAADAVVFENVSWEWAQSGCGNMLQYFDPTTSYLISLLYGQLYACTDRVPLAAHFINVALGVVIVYLISRIAARLWNRQAALRAAWIAALYPVLVIYSSVTLREPFVAVGLLAGVLCIILWLQKKRIRYFILSMPFLLLATMFHGGMFFAFLGLIVFFVASALAWLARTKSPVISRSGFAAGILLMSFTIGALAFLGEVKINKLGDITELGVESIEGVGESQRGESYYPAFLAGEAGANLIWQTPVRMVYLLFGPPPWEVRAPNHLIGFADGLLYMLMAFLLWRYRAIWLHRSDFLVVIAVFLSLTLVFGWGVSNFGTGFRHRAKFVGLLIAMSAGLLGRKRWRDKQLAQAGTRKPFNSKQ